MKRANNEGSVYKRADGRWAASVSLGNGRRRAFYGKTRQEVSRRLNNALKAVQDGLTLPQERETVHHYLDGWLESTARPRVRPTTYEGYARIVRLHVGPEIGNVRLARLSPQILSALYGRLLVKGLSPTSVNKVHAMMHTALSQALRWRLVALNAADAVDPPRRERKEFRTLSADEAEQLMAESRGDRFHALYVLAVTSGLRAGELFGLRWADIDFDNRVLAVRQQALRINGGWYFSEPKTAKGRRTVTLPAIAIEMLAQHRRTQIEERLSAGPEWEALDLVFPNHRGRPMERQNFERRSYWPLLARAGLPRIRFHDLRHTAATLLLSQGVHPKVVQERLGHSTIAVTMDVYSHVMPTLQREAADTLDRLFAAR